MLLYLKYIFSYFIHIHVLSTLNFLNHMDALNIILQNSKQKLKHVKTQFKRFLV